MFAILSSKTLIKGKLPNGLCIDLFEPVITQLIKSRQIGKDTPERGGYLIGYENAKTLNYTILSATPPSRKDYSKRYFIRLCSMNHLKSIELKKTGGYIGTWHTHPQEIPYPSSIDIKDWKESLKFNRKSTSYLIFIIVGLSCYRVWVGDCNTFKIFELKETNHG